MSERRAKRNRKEMASEIKKTEKNPKKVLSNIVIAVVIAAVAGLGAYASYDKIKSELPTASEDASSNAAETQTIADLAESRGITAEELLANCGMTELGLTAESTADEMYAQFTIDSYAKFEEKTADELKAEYGIEQLANDTNWQEAQMLVPMSKIAEQSGMSFDEFAEQNGLPESITEDMTYEEAIMAIQEQMAADGATAETEETESAEADDE